jgi:starch synthase
VFLMPSKFEPCGLNQLYSLRYGTVPIVHRVGGLADTVVDASAANLAQGSATGFVFDTHPSTDGGMAIDGNDALRATLQRALDLYADPTQWQALQSSGMTQNFTWAASAQIYQQLYQVALAERNGSTLAMTLVN